jgi:hypothetical protein
MNPTDKVTISANGRRSFLKTLGGVGAAITATAGIVNAQGAPARAAGAKYMGDFAAPKLDTIRIALIGVGARGTGHAQQLASIEGTQIVAISDLYEDWAKRSEKNVVAMIVDNSIDDAKPLMLEADRLRVEAFEDKFWEGFLLSVSCYEELFYSLTRVKGADRKDFALDHAPKMRETDHFGPSIIFSMYNEVEARSTSQITLDVIRKNMNTGTKIDTVRYLWGGHRWDYASTEG